MEEDIKILKKFIKASYDKNDIVSSKNLADVIKATEHTIEYIENIKDIMKIAETNRALREQKYKDNLIQTILNYNELMIKSILEDEKDVLIDKNLQTYIPNIDVTEEMIKEVENMKLKDLFNKLFNKEDNNE